MSYDPSIHHRRTIRLRGYDYSQEGAYFITICTQNRRCVFGHVRDNTMILNEYGQVAYQEWEKLPERWPHIELGVFQIMPNHMHGIIIIGHVGAPLAGAQSTGVETTVAQPTGAETTGAQHTNAGTPEPARVDWAPARGAQSTGVETTVAQPTGAETTGAQHTNAGTPEPARVDWAPARGAPTAGQIVGGYKSCVTTACIKIAKSKQPEFILGKLWQRNFWEHIIRNLVAFDRISSYIIANPEQWASDKFYHKG